MTGIRFELFTDIEQMVFVEKGLKGGTSTITHSHAGNNNPLVPNYDPSTESNYIIYYHIPLLLEKLRHTAEHNTKTANEKKKRLQISWSIT